MNQNNLLICNLYLSYQNDSKKKRPSQASESLSFVYFLAIKQKLTDYEKSVRIRKESCNEKKKRVNKDMVYLYYHKVYKMSTVHFKCLNNLSCDL